MKLFSKRILSIFQKRSYPSVKWTRIPYMYDNSLQRETKLSTLPSGLRVVTHYMPGPTATVGLFIDSGSRAETVENNGVAHFFEHMAFKGTATLSQHQMETEVENMGARLFAYTSREQTVYYGKCFVRDTQRVLEILGEIVQNPLLSQEAIDRERGVILREMEDIETQLNEVIFDHLHSTAYQGTPLSFTILGPTENVQKISKKDLQDYISKHYTAGRIVVIAVGDIDHDSLVSAVKSNFSQIPATSDADLMKWYVPSNYLGSSVLLRNDDMPHAHVAVAYEAVPPTHPDFMPLMLATTYLGSWDQSCTNGKVMPSFMAQYISKEDCARTFTSFYAPYKDTGLWGFYYTAKKDQLDTVYGVMHNQLKNLQLSLTEGALEQAKNALKTNYIMQVDGTTPMFEEIGRQILTYGRPITLAEFEEEIELCTPEVVENALKRLIDSKCVALAAMGPIEALPDYYRMRKLGDTYFS